MEGYRLTEERVAGVRGFQTKEEVAGWKVTG